MLYLFWNGHLPKVSAEVIKSKTEQANQNLGINKQIEQDEVLPSAAVPSLDAAESRLYHKINKNLKTNVA